MKQYKYHISGESTVADILIDNEQLICMLNRFNIPLGIGNMSFKDLAEKHDIELNALLNISRITIGETSQIDNCNFESIKDIISFLKNSHKSLQDNKISIVNDLIDKFSKEIPEKYGMMLKTFFKTYIKEVTEHFYFEDKIVFPYILDLHNSYRISNNKNFDFDIEQFQVNHSDIEEKLRDLKNILIRHIPSNIDSHYRNIILSELYDLETDINLHSQIEDLVLIPLIIHLELEYNKKKKKSIR